MSYLHFHIGAKEAHKVSPHFTQVLYFGAAAMFAMLPVHLDFVLIRENVELLARAVQTRSINFLASILIGSLACVHYFRYFFSYFFNQWYISCFSVFLFQYSMSFKSFHVMIHFVRNGHVHLKIRHWFILNSFVSLFLKKGLIMIVSQSICSMHTLLFGIL